MKQRIKGITLIALVITIVVILILSTVVLQLSIGKSGIITKAIAAAFYTEMAGIEEKVNLYKMEKDDAIPVKELCDIETLNNGKRLIGESGYYRQWYMTEMQPTAGLFLNNDEDFNNEYKSEFVNFPQGVQDLYFLDNKTIGIHNSNKYLIDAETGIIYKISGVKLNGITVYSKSMYSQVNGGTIKPEFQTAEVTGNQLTKKLAGNTDSNTPYGFQIIANPSSNNIFKLYNTGELYGKGIKGCQINTSQDEMQKINPYIWQEWNLPDKLKEYKNIIIGENENIYLIDKNDDLWAIGNNAYNQFGLTQEQLVNYTSREWIQLDVDGNKIKQVFTNLNNTFVITQDNKLYGAGLNQTSQIGIGNVNIVQKFSLIDFEKVDKIQSIKSGMEEDATIISCTDNTFYCAGWNKRDFIGTGNSDSIYNKFIKIWDGSVGPDIDQDIEDIIKESGTIVLKKDGTMWLSGHSGYIGKNLTTDKEASFRKYNVDNVKKIMKLGYRGILFVIENNEEKEYWVVSGSTNSVGTDNCDKMVKLNLPSELVNNGVKEVKTLVDCIYFLDNNGNVYGCGYNNYLGKNISTGANSNVEKLEIENILSLNALNVQNSNSGRRIALLQGNDGKIYTTGSSSLLFQNKIIQSIWYKIADNVLYFDASGGCYVDKENNLWVSGNNSEILGLGTQITGQSEVPNYIMCTDENIKGKAIETQIASVGLIGVKLMDGSLWTSGYYNKDGVLGYPGWEENENKTTFSKILDNVTKWSIFDRIRTAISNGKLYGWGSDYGGSTGSTLAQSNIPVECTNLPEEIKDVNNIEKLEINSWTITHVVTKTGKLFVTGNWANGSYWGGQQMTSYYSEYTHNLNLSADETIKDMKWINNSTAIILTSKGNLYGFGSQNYLGINSTSEYLTETIKLPIENVEKITSGNRFFIAIKNDGTVWGTGTNINGVLGRWIGIDRKSPNTIYKTAYTWVECPDLEI